MSSLRWWDEVDHLRAARYIPARPGSAKQASPGQRAEVTALTSEGTAPSDGGNANRGPAIGSQDYRAFVGPTATYDLISASQFNLLTFLGLREDHYLLDIGCGSLRAGRLFIPYLAPGRYHGIEPEKWLVEEGLRNEVGSDLAERKNPAFSHDSDFTLSTFDRTFDFLLAQSIFSHASERQIVRCLSEARKVMHAGSIFAATFVKGPENYSGDAWVYPGCVEYTPRRMEERAGEHGLVWKETDWPHPTDQTWVLITTADGDAALPELGDSARLLQLETELRYQKERLSRIQGHPYVRVGMRVNELLQSLRRRARRQRP